MMGPMFSREPVKNGGSALLQLYDSLWRDAVESYAAGRVQIDPYLVNRDFDRRLGLTVIARPDRHLCDQFSALVRELAQIEPCQHFYQPSEFHVTILSLLTATDPPQPCLARTHSYLTTLTPILSAAEGFDLCFRGVSATSSSILVQGFPESDQLESLRERIRQALRANGLGAGLDERYRITSAHTTLVRFKNQLQDPKRLIATLATCRDRDFGRSHVAALQLVKSDWYMSANRLEVLAEYPLF